VDINGGAAESRFYYEMSKVDALRSTSCPAAADERPQLHAP
jgi:hypothetical protein